MRLIWVVGHVLHSAMHSVGLAFRVSTSVPNRPCPPNCMNERSCSLLICRASDSRYFVCSLMLQVIH